MISITAALLFIGCQIEVGYTEGPTYFISAVGLFMFLTAIVAAVVEKVL